MSKRIAVIGGGISGLTTAFLLKQKGLDVTLFEASPEVGGNIRSEAKDGYLLEHGPNSLLRSPRIVDLIDALGLRGEVLPTSAAAKKRFVLIGGELKAMPGGFASFLFGGYFSIGTKLRLLREPFVSSRSAASESVAEFFERRLGSEIVRKAADPFISGIFAGDPEKLSIAHAFPLLYEYERDHGSLIRGALRNKNEKVNPDFPRSFTFKNGLRTLPETLQARLAESVQVNTAVEKIERADAGFGLSTGGASDIFAAVVISTRADAAAQILSEFDPHLAAKLRDVYYPPITVVRSGYAHSAVKRLTEGFGFLVPRTENRKILGSLWTSSVFPDRAPDGMCLFTSFFCGARSPQLC
ncbi:protoporphyrinogen oxidase [soil metagenome]